MAREALRSLRNEDYTDRELLHLLHDHADDEGWADLDDVVIALRIRPPYGFTGGAVAQRRYAMQCVATRYGWMRRYGWVERGVRGWRLTEIGWELAQGFLTPAVERALDKLDSGDRVLLMRRLTDAFRRDRIEAATMLRREWQHGARRNGR